MSRAVRVSDRWWVGFRLACCREEKTRKGNIFVPLSPSLWYRVTREFAQQRTWSKSKSGSRSGLILSSFTLHSSSRYMMDHHHRLARDYLFLMPVNDRFDRLRSWFSFNSLGEKSWNFEAHKTRFRAPQSGGGDDGRRIVIYNCSR